VQLITLEISPSLRAYNNAQCALELASYFLIVISDHESSSPSGQTKGLDMALSTRLPKYWRKMVILAFHMGKLSLSNLSGQYMLDLTLPDAMGVQNKYSD